PTLRAQTPATRTKTSSTTLGRTAPSGSSSWQDSTKSPGRIASTTLLPPGTSRCVPAAKQPPGEASSHAALAAAAWSSVASADARDGAVDLRDHRRRGGELLRQVAVVPQPLQPVADPVGRQAEAAQHQLRRRTRGDPGPAALEDAALAVGVGAVDGVVAGVEV